ncbi:hypothetical protein HK097_004904 [Rhizophlyctis rosea]|uniref:Uncharacterized protein n=1 Tax=Rhizophlyctis rosea TaxID=64517 RepID=A0AAD5SFD3_9FUNG|nr:hypothetical protein HK097_004904 [Rhizophlyctis rosea]
MKKLLQHAQAVVAHRDKWYALEHPYVNPAYIIALTFWSLCDLMHYDVINNIGAFADILVAFVDLKHCIVKEVGPQYPITQRNFSARVETMLQVEKAKVRGGEVSHKKFGNVHRKDYGVFDTCDYALMDTKSGDGVLACRGWNAPAYYLRKNGRGEFEATD